MTFFQLRHLGKFGLLLFDGWELLWQIGSGNIGTGMLLNMKLLAGEDCLLTFKSMYSI